MQVFLVAAAFAISPAGTADYTSPTSAASHLESRVQTGTLLVSKGDCLAVKVFTCSRYTHIAVVVKQDGTTWVYESANGRGVVRQSLAEYLDNELPNTVYTLNPRKPFSRRRTRVFKKYLDSQLGREYGVKHYAVGKRADGVHCAEYLTDALMAVGMIHAKRPSRVSPASLAKGTLQTGLYTAGVAVDLQEANEKSVGRNRCQQMWIDTKYCTANFCVKMRRWFACR